MVRLRADDDRFKVVRDVTVVVSGWGNEDVLISKHCPTEVNHVGRAAGRVPVVVVDEDGDENAAVTVLRGVIRHPAVTAWPGESVVRAVLTVADERVVTVGVVPRSREARGGDVAFCGPRFSGFVHAVCRAGDDDCRVDASVGNGAGDAVLQGGVAELVGS